jgi:hypothetical protein
VSPLISPWVASAVALGGDCEGLRHWESMTRAFSPWVLCGLLTQAVGLGWDDLRLWRSADNSGFQPFGVFVGSDTQAVGLGWDDARLWRSADN